MSTWTCAPASAISLEPWLTPRWDIPTPPHRRYSSCFSDCVNFLPPQTRKIVQLLSLSRMTGNKIGFCAKTIGNFRVCYVTLISGFFSSSSLCQKFLMTPSPLPGCLDAGTPPSHAALRSSSHQLASGTGIGVYSGSYPKSQSYYNTSDATALYSRVCCRFPRFLRDTFRTAKTREKYLCSFSLSRYE